MITQSTGVNGWRDEVMPKRVHLNDGRHAGGVAVIKGIHALGQGRRGGRFDCQQAGAACHP